MDARKKFYWIAGVFLVAYFLPVEAERLRSGLVEAVVMLHEYAREHVLTCLIPAFFIAGAISVFVSKAAVMRYFGARANKWLSYSVASVSGTILAVCSCTVLPLFAGLYTRGAGIGPATAFLYSGPAINVLAIILTARILGAPLGLARAVGAVAFAVVIGLIMAALFRGQEGDEEDDFGWEEEAGGRSLGQHVLYFATMVLILVFAAWSKPKAPIGFWAFIYSIHWWLAGALLILLAWMLVKWFQKPELKEWVHATSEFMLQIFPLLFAGVLAAGLLMGRPGQDNGLIPNRYVEMLVGGNSLWANFFAALSGAFMYFATLTEVPILQGLLGSGMGKGPALALLLAGPALSLPSMLVIRSIMGTKKALVYILLVVILSTFTGKVFGTFFG
jgi:uncharacterized membrane protein YraQ (UPF0718 family)